MIQRKPVRIAMVAIFSMVSFLATVLVFPYFGSSNALSADHGTSIEKPLHSTAKTDSQLPLESSEKEEESRSDKSEQSFIVVLHEEVSMQLTLASISRLNFFVRSVEKTQAWLPLYLTKCSFLI